MQTTKKIFIALFFLILITTQIFAFDFGAEISNTFGIKNVDDFGWLTNNSAVIWATVPFGETKNNFSIEGGFYGSKSHLNDDYLYFIDLDLFRFRFTPIEDTSLVLSIDAGRITNNDITGKIFNQYIDGVEFHFIHSFFSIDALLGYTGLLNARKASYLITTDDFNSVKGESIYELGSQRLVGKATALLPQLFLSSDLVFEFIGQLDLRKNFNDGYFEVADSLYASLGLNGPITSSIFYNINATLQHGVLTDEDADKKFGMLSLLASARLDFFLPANNHILVSVDYNTANTDKLTGLMPLTITYPGSLYSGTYTNHLNLKGEWSWMPQTNINLSANAIAFMLSPGGNTSDLYQGTEANLSLLYKILSDVKIQAKTAVFYGKDNNFNYLASLKLILEL